MNLDYQLVAELIEASILHHLFFNIQKSNQSLDSFKIGNLMTSFYLSVCFNIYVKPCNGVEFVLNEKIWGIKGVSTSIEYVENTLEALFSKHIGFLYLRYKFYNNTTINLELIKVEEKVQRKK